MNQGPERVKSCAVVGAGVIGRSWARLFLQAGLRTFLFDPSPSQIKKALEWIQSGQQRGLEQHLLTPQDVQHQHELLAICHNLDEAVELAAYVQESGPEDLSATRKIYASLEEVSQPDTILASSTSALDMSAIAAELETPERCIVAHPVNPPHLIPVVEVLGGEKTDRKVVDETMAFLRSIGQTPVLLNFFLPGFLLNRMQAALVREAINLVRCGVADVDAVDAVIRDGLGLRWALFGPFGVANTNDDEGVRGYCTKFGRAYEELSRDLDLTSRIPADLVSKLGEGTDHMVHGAPPSECAEWRDAMVAAIRALKKENPGPLARPEGEDPDA